VVPELAPKESYSRAEVLRLLGISDRLLRNWEQHGFIRTTDYYVFSDLIALRTLLKLKHDRIPPATIKRALEALRDKLAHVSEPLKELKIVADGKRIHVEIADQRMEATSGQLLFDFDQKELRRLLAFPKESGKAQERARKESAEGWFQKGLELEQRGAPIEQAIAAYMTAADLDPSSAGALVNLGTIYFNARQWNKAEAFYTRALEVDTNYALAHFNLGNLYDERGKLKLALKHYQAAVGLNPNYADAHYNLALLHQGNGQVMDAVRHWTIYLKLDPGSSWGAIARRELDKLRKSALVPGSDSMRAPTSA
jgi:tetratricopeptide (TPR) repeat protein